jgi:hypothetical protein
MNNCCNNDTILMSVVYLKHRSDCSSHKRDGSGSGDDWTMNAMSFMRAAQNNLFATTIVASKYFMTYHDRNDPITPIQCGFSWIVERLNTGRSHKMFRMDSSLFYQLHDLLLSTYDLRSLLHINSVELLAMFLVICGHGMSNSAIHGIFSHSGETISRKFDEVLNCVVAICKDYIRPIDPNFRTTHQRITDDRRMMPYFKGCIGALDGTHILATPPPHDVVRYIGRTGKATQNVLDVVMLTYNSHMHQLDNLDQCMTLMCCFMR